MQLLGGDAFHMVDKKGETDVFSFLL